MSFASSKDPEWDKNHPNKAMEVVPSAFMHYESGQSFLEERGKSYESYKEDLSKRIIKEVYKHCPHLKDQISYYELSTPLTTRNLANYELGELYGIEHDSKDLDKNGLNPKPLLKIYT